MNTSKFFSLRSLRENSQHINRRRLDQYYKEPAEALYTWTAISSRVMPFLLLLLVLGKGKFALLGIIGLMIATIIAVGMPILASRTWGHRTRDVWKLFLEEVKK